MPPARRVDHLEKAQRLQDRARGRGTDAEPPVTKLTTRLPSEQVAWLKSEAKGYRERNPRRPRATIEELIAVAVDHLRETKNLDSVIAKYRS